MERSSEPEAPSLKLRVGLSGDEISECHEQKVCLMTKSRTQQPCYDQTVFYPHGGHHALLRWYTDDDRGHIILAKSSRPDPLSVTTTFKAVLNRYPGAKITDYQKIDILAPSDLLQNLSRKARYNDALNNFHLKVIDKLSEIIDSVATLPGPFSICQEYKPPKSLHLDDWVLKEHFQCSACINRIRTDISRKETFERYFDAWNVLFPQNNQTTSKNLRIPSRAPKASDSQPLWYARANFGHHESGVELKLNNFAEPFISDNVLFYYSFISNLDQSGLNRISKIHSELLRSNLESQKTIQINKSKLEKEKLAAELIKFFNKKKNRRT